MKLRQAEAEAAYFRKIAENSGKGRLRDIEQLSRLISKQLQMHENNLKLEAHLQQTQKMEAIGMMAAGIAHDLNNVLAGIVGFPDLLLMQLPADSPIRTPITAIRNSGKKAAAIVQDLLTLARKGAVNHEVTNLNEIVTEYIKSPEFAKLLSFHPNVEMTVDLDPNLMNIIGFPIHLSKVIMNLVSNASEAMANGGVITITTCNRHYDAPVAVGSKEMTGDCILLSVSDTGTGISPEDREKIFDPFYTKKKAGRSGTGLGMTVVWGAVKDHKGAIDIQSAQGKGTTFLLCFPATELKKTEIKAASPLEAIMGQGESILVVDDVADQRELASSLLNQLNYSVTAVLSGEQALQHLKQSKADLIILDMIMDPGMDGLETFKKILEFRPVQKAIIASGYSETKRVREARALGAGRYLQKPYTLEQIGLAVKAELGPC